ncbi:hypothetical protein GJAV_G00048900 [Gymnothorax javanicus]|nr:hypothetical protein GJAV_G00048900 [Gymnothorax javanicus]
MAAATRAIVQAVRPHSPLIKFPNRLGVPRPEVQEIPMTMVAPAQMSGAHSSPPPTAAPPTQAVGPPDTAASVAGLPPRYRRRPLAAEEIDYIQRGGPE